MHLSLLVFNQYKLNIITLNLDGKHKVRSDNRTLFYMPHCPYSLYNSVLWANWGQNLSRLIIIGNSFNNYIDNTNSSYQTGGIILAI